jgi:transcriptional regulator with XRE-family HTH domain
MSEVAMMTDIDFAALVRLIRQSRGQTQEELARDLDVTVGTMNGWENGKHRPVKAQRRRLVTMAEEMGLAVPGADRDHAGGR